jgi:hypothetical protein
MSVAATSFVWERSEAEGADRLVLLALADFADENGNCFGSWGKLEQKTRLSRATVARCLRRLQDSGDLLMVEKGHRRIAGDGAEATVWRIAGLSPEMGLRLRPVSSCDPSSVTMRPKWCQDETPTISNIKKHIRGATPATLSPSHPPKREEPETGAPEPEPRKAKAPVEVVGPDSLPLPHSGSGFYKWWGEFCEFRRGKIRGRNNPLTRLAATIILAELGTVNEWQAVEAIKTAIACAYVKPYTDKYRDKRGGAQNPQPLPQQASGPSALERSLQRARMEVAA